jgi:hypothetical protein
MIVHHFIISHVADLHCNSELDEMLSFSSPPLKIELKVLDDEE